MNTDTAGNPIFSVPAYCGQCCAPTNTAGVCPNGCEGSPIVTAKVAEDWKALAEERGREIERLRAEKERLRSSHCDCRERADQAEARLARVVEAAKQLFTSIETIERQAEVLARRVKDDRPVEAILFECRRVRAALAAAQPEEERRG